MKRTSLALLSAGIGALVLFGVIGLAGAAAPAMGLHARIAATEVVKGTIESVDLTANEFTVAVKKESAAPEATKMIFKFNDKTEYMLDGKSSTRADALKSGREATVSHENRIATRVDVKTK